MDKLPIKNQHGQGAGLGVSSDGFNETDCNRKQTKTERVLAAFIDGWAGHRFNAEWQLHDHSLHSTVSSLQNRHDVLIDRETVTVRGFQGAKTPVAKYWLPKDQKEKAIALLSLFRSRRGCKEVDQ